MPDVIRGTQILITNGMTRDVSFMTVIRAFEFINWQFLDQLINGSFFPETLKMTSKE
jgi:hypothetical protein